MTEHMQKIEEKEKQENKYDLMRNLEDFYIFE
jgi:hypothetical protein